MGLTTQDILKKINYIEADMEIHRQIIFSIPSDNKQEIENTLRLISQKKDQVAKLRTQIKEIDPEEFERIVRFEEASAKFKKLASEKKFKEIIALSESQECILKLKNNDSLPCLVKAKDESGEWTVLTFDGEIRTYSGDEVEI
ncbi:conserved hypothetical protein [Desulfamplus magnetovallimortis]|uniref:Uncharacterized protein n=1 Tax=Desulfamplus magnetovallimortis TaxID=1246637 RepID=A0A1W1H9C7_9BACT|nr:hypothetical protein [Desulfamplus magnetovallimortis]SLM29044.1 conserved hypothetical protein [Desulfamplus magnetovallimortis]